MSPTALKTLIEHDNCYKIVIDWIKEKVDYHPYKRWIELWGEK